MVVTIQSKTLTLPAGLAEVFISLFYADGCDGFPERDIYAARDLIAEHNIVQLISAGDPIDGQCEMEFGIKS